MRYYTSRVVRLVPDLVKLMVSFFQLLEGEMMKVDKLINDVEESKLPYRFGSPAEVPLKGPPDLLLFIYKLQ